MTLEAAGPSTPKTLFANADDRWIGPYDWSPDDKWLAVQLTRKEGPGQIGLLAVSDGTLKILGSHSTTKMSFSPDGTLVAYDRIVPGTSAQRDVFLMSLDGTRDVAVAAHPADDTVMGWAPDGTALLFASDRSGSRALWSLPIANGKPAGPPALIKSDLGPKAVSLGVTRSGGLVYSIQTSAQNIQTAEIDFATGKILSPSTQAVEGYSLYNLDPDWSRDGKSLVYVSERAHGERALSILSQENGRVRELRPRMSYRRPRWAPDGSITIQVSDRPQGIYRVDAQSGDVSPIVVSGPDVTSDLPAWSPDGTLLVYRRRGAGENVVVVREVASGRERVLVRGRALSGVNMSPDGQGVSYIEYDAATKSSTLNVIPVQGGASRELFRAADPVRVGNLVEWTPDGRRLVFGKSENGRVNVSLWIVSSTGGTPTKLELDPKSTVINLRIHPDGRHVAFLTGSGNSLEVWKLENFLPAATTAKK